MAERFARAGEGRTLQVAVKGTRFPGIERKAPRAASLQASERRVADKRERRHREQAIAAWLRDLGR